MNFYEMKGMLLNKIQTMKGQCSLYTKNRQSNPRKLFQRNKEQNENSVYCRA